VGTLKRLFLFLFHTPHSRNRYTQIKIHTMKYILFITFLSLIALSSCNKNNKIKISDDLLNCCFKTDTHWVYIDSVSNDIDSVYVVNHDHYYQEEYDSQHISHDIEYFTFCTRSSLNLESADYKILSQSLTQYINTNYHTIYYDYDRTSDGALGQGGNAFFHLDSIFIYDQYYYRVFKVEDPDDTTENYNKSIYYTNSEYGILRHDIYSDSVLLSSKRLMRKNIIR